MSGHTAILRRVFLTCQIAGLCIFVVSFFLPACAAKDQESHGLSPGTFQGWQCAQATGILAVIVVGSLGAVLAGKLPHTGALILPVLGGCINPLIVLYLLVSRKPRLAKRLRIMALAIIICMVATWIFFATSGWVPLIGHYLWILGTLMMLSPELLRRRHQSPQETGEFSPGAQ